jgi:hypothetical protein
MFKVDIIKSKTLEDLNKYLIDKQVEGVIILDVKALNYDNNYESLKYDFLITLGARK